MIVVDDEFEEMWKEAILAYFNVISQRGLSKTTETLGQPGTPRISTAWIRIWYIEIEVSRCAS
jgi:hypothetical protein